MFKVSKKRTTLEQCVKSILFTVNNKDTRTMSGVSIVNFEHISHFILLLILPNSNK